MTVALAVPAVLVVPLATTIACRVLSRINVAWCDVQWARTGPGCSRRTWQ
ncbi:MAG: hypothetical protein ACRDTH_27505 [Pseudonocardiaceae bacterium]